MNEQIDIAIITIKDEEFRAVLKRFPGGEPAKFPNHYYHVTQVAVTGGDVYKVAIARCNAQGNSEAQALATSMIDDLDPLFLLIVGIGGGVPAVEYSLGDVIVSSYINDFQVGAINSNGTITYSQRGGAVPHDAAALAAFLPALEERLGPWNTEIAIGLSVPTVPMTKSRFYGSEEWISKVRKSLRQNFPKNTTRMPRYKDGPIDCSDFVIKDATTLDQWMKSARDAKAIDMESSGVYAAVQHSRRAVPFLAIRGLSDVVGYIREQAWTEYACHTAASFTRALIGAGILPLRNQANLISPSSDPPIEAQSTLVLIRSAGPGSQPSQVDTSTIAAQIASEPNNSSPTTAISPDDIIAQSRIDAIRELIASGRSVAAKALLDQARNELWSKVSRELRSKIANNQGCVAMNLDDLDQALKYFEEAISYTPNNALVLSNQAVTKLLLGNNEEALIISTKAREVDPLLDRAASTWLQALQRIHGPQAVLDALSSEGNRWMTTSVTCRGALAQIQIAQCEYGKAEQILRELIQSNEGQDDLQLFLLLGQSIVTPIRGRVSWHDIRKGVLDQNDRNRLLDALEIYSKAITIVSNYDYQSPLNATLVDRAATYLFLGEYDQAINDCDRVLGSDPNNMPALMNKAQALISKEQADEAITVLELAVNIPRLAPDSSRFAASTQGQQLLHEALFLLAGAYLRIGEHDKTLAVLDHEALPNDDIGAFRRAELTLYAAARSTTPEKQKAIDAAVSYLEANWSEDPRTHAILAQYFEGQNNFDNALEHRKLALELSGDKDKRHYQLDLASAHYRAQQFEQAADMYEPYVSTSSDQADHRAFFISLYNSGRYSDALNAGRELREKFGVVPKISELEVNILERAGDLASARNVLNALIQGLPDDAHLRIRAAYLEFRDGEVEKARELALTIPFDLVSNDAMALMNLAKLRQILKLPDVLKYAYQARRVEYSDPDAHVEYVTLCLSQPPDTEEYAKSVSERQTVSEGDAVTLVRFETTITLIIESDEPVHPERGEISMSDPRAGRLLGRKVGDTVALREGILGPEEYSIKEIKSKFVYACHETSNLFQQGLLEHASFQVMDIRQPNLIEQLGKNLSAQMEGRPDYWAMYQQGPLPLGSFAKMVNRPLVDLWLALTSAPQAHLIAFSGDQSDITTHLRNTDRADPLVVMDLMALFTIVHLGLEEAVKQRFKQLAVSRATMDRLLQYEQELNNATDHIGTATSIGGILHFIEVDPSMVERRPIFIKRLLDFAKSSLTTLPTIGLLEADQKIQQLLGDDNLSTILLVKERDGILYSDDLWLRRAAETMFEVTKTLDTQSVITDLRNRSVVKEEERYRLLSTLANSGYRYVLIEIAGLISLLEQSGFTINTSVQAAFALYEGTVCDEYSGIEAMAEVIKQAWTRSVLVHQRLFVLDLALSTLMSGRRPFVIGKLQNRLKAKFFLVEHIYVQVAEQIILWCQGRGMI